MQQVSLLERISFGANDKLQHKKHGYTSAIILPFIHSITFVNKFCHKISSRRRRYSDDSRIDHMLWISPGAADGETVSGFPRCFGLPNVNGIYRYFIMCLIWRFIVKQKRMIKYMTRIGQNTGTLKTSKNVQMKPIIMAFVAEYQNLNSGSRRINGRNSSFVVVGKLGPSSSS